MSYLYRQTTTFSLRTKLTYVDVVLIVFAVLLDDGRGRKRDAEEGGTRRKEGRAGKSDEESEKIKKQKVARGRIVDPRGLV